MASHRAQAGRGSPWSESAETLAAFVRGSMSVAGCPSPSLVLALALTVVLALALAFVVRVGHDVHHGTAVGHRAATAGLTSFG
jgi:fatty acid desaturase